MLASSDTFFCIFNTRRYYNNHNSNNGSGNIISSTASFNNIVVYQGTYLSKSFTVDGSLDQRFLIDNSFVDTSTISCLCKGFS